MESPQPKTPSEKEKPEFNFLYVEHSPERFEDLKPELQNVDAILIEWVADNETKRDVEELVYQASLEKDVNKKNRYIELLSSTEGDNFTSNVIKFAIENEKQIYFIDETPEEIGTQLGMQAKTIFEYSKGQIEQGNIQESLDAFRKYHQYQSKFVKIRDTKVSQQIEDIVNKNDLKGLRFAVIQGEYHRGTYRKIKLLDLIKSTRKFDSKTKIFELESEITELIELGESEKAEQLIKRDYFCRFVLLKNDIETGLSLSNDELDKIARSITDSDVEMYLQRLSKIKDLFVEGYNGYNSRIMSKQIDNIAFDIIEKYYKK